MSGLKTFGVSYDPETEDLPERFDDYFEDKAAQSGETYNRSREVKNAMELWLTIHQAAEKGGFQIADVRSSKHWLISALLDYERRVAGPLEGDT